MSRPSNYIPHPVVDIDLAELIYLPGAMGPLGDVWSSDQYGVAATKIMRDHIPGLSDRESKPTDVFAFEKGPAIASYHTKLGGRPYRFPNAPWPQYLPTRQDSFFVGQICFIDSSELLNGLELPGDVLLIFAMPDHDAWDGSLFPVLGSHEDDGLQTEWVRISDELNQLIQSDSSSRPAMEEYRGCRHRSCDYVDTAWVVHAASAVDEYKYPSSLAAVAREYKFKIGGVSCFDAPNHRSKGFGDYLAGFGEFFPSRLNKEWRRAGMMGPPPNFDRSEFHEGLGLLDGRHVELFMNSRGVVQAVIDDPFRPRSE